MAPAVALSLNFDIRKTPFAEEGARIAAEVDELMPELCKLVHDFVEAKMPGACVEVCDDQKYDDPWACNCNQCEAQYGRDDRFCMECDHRVDKIAQIPPDAEVAEDEHLYSMLVGK